MSVRIDIMKCLVLPALWTAYLALLLATPSLHGVDASLSSPAPSHNNSASADGPCVLSTSADAQEALQEILLSGVYTVNLNLQMHPFEEESFRRLSRDLAIFRPLAWRRTRSRQGQTMLMLSDISDVLSLSLLGIRVGSLDVAIAVTPRGCLRRLTSEEILRNVRSLLLNDFHAKGLLKPNGATTDVNICHQKLRSAENSTADFVNVCCQRRERGGEVVCHDLTSDPWLEALFTAVLIIKVLVMLYSPNFLPKSAYQNRHTLLQEYVCPLPTEIKLTMKKKKKKTEKKGCCIKKPPPPPNVMKSSELKRMPRLKEMVDQWKFDTSYDVKVKKVCLAVVDEKLLEEQRVHINLGRVLYNSLFLCRLCRRHSRWRKCCSRSVFSGSYDCPRTQTFTWTRCTLALRHLLLMAIFVLPWVMRVVIYYKFEKPISDEKTKAACEAGLSIPFTDSFILYLSPVHGAFIICYVILAADILLFCVLSPYHIEKMKIVTQSCLHEMSETSAKNVFGLFADILWSPFETWGMLYLPLLLAVFVVLLPVLIPLLAFYMFPAVNLSCRLLFQINLRDQLQKFWDQLKRHTDCSVDKPKTILVAPILLVTFWSVTFLLMDLLVFAVEIAVYSFIGLILTFDVTSQYVSIIFFIVLYGHGFVSDINSKYLSYHKLVQEHLLSLVDQEEVKKVAQMNETDQENMAFWTKDRNSRKLGAELKVRDGVPVWKMSGVVVFLSRKDAHLTPEKFFEQTVQFNAYGCPGKLYDNCIKALKRFAKIVVFLIFVFIVVMAFGRTYRVSATNQLLATVAGGFIPFAFRYFFASKKGDCTVDSKSVKFQTEIQDAVNSFQQTWPVFDFDKPIEATPTSDQRLEDNLDLIIYVSEDPSHEKTVSKADVVIMRSMLRNLDFSDIDEDKDCRKA